MTIVPVYYCVETNQFLHHFNIEYPLDGKVFSVSIKAASWEEAERHAAMMQHARVAGEIVATEDA